MIDWAFVPEEVLVRLLVSLPLAAQARLRCVCKRWRSLLSSNYLQHMRSLLIPTLRPWFVVLASNSDRWWLTAYDPADEQWHRLALQLGSCSRMRILFASAGTMLCFAVVNRSVFRGSTVWIGNLFTGSKTMIPSPPSRFFSHENGDGAEDLRERFQALVVDRDGGQFKLLVEGYYRTLDIYDSTTRRWTTTEMDLPSSVDFSISRPYLKGILYCLAKNPARLVTYDVENDTWNDHLALISSSICNPCLIQHRGEVLMVGAVGGRRHGSSGWHAGEDDQGKAEVLEAPPPPPPPPPHHHHHQIKRICIWKLRRSLSDPWEEIACMPEALQRAYLERSGGKSLYFVGQGDLVYFASLPVSVSAPTNEIMRESLVYDVMMQRWQWVEECPESVVTRGGWASPSTWRSAFGLPNVLACDG